MKKINKVAIAIFIPVLIFASSVSFASAQSLPGLTKSFGGVIVAYVPPSPLCPVAHTVIFDFASNTPIGIATVFGTRVYMNYNLVSTGTFVLGTAAPTPIPCVVPYLIYPINIVGTS